MEQRAYRAVFFDLDGTLLPMDLDEFLAGYFKRIVGYAAAHGYNAERFYQAFMNGTKAMMAQDGVVNRDAFWATFAKEYGLRNEELIQAEELFGQFYVTLFNEIGQDVQPSQPMVRAVEALVAKGYPLVLATMPLFPRVAVEQRLRWAGLDASMFAHLTTYENSTSVKPKLDYYREVLAAVGAQSEEVLMVGNNTQEDLSSMALGVDAFLVTDWLLDPISYDTSQVKHGSGEEFAAWVEQLPTCVDPLAIK